MKRNFENILVIAQKEFADSIWSSRFYLILGIFMTMLLVYGYKAGQNMVDAGGKPFGGIFSPLSVGFMGLSHPISVFGALVAIGLGFDTIVKERKSGSLNVLLTHPVYRDQVITGKLSGMMVTLSLITVISVVTSTGVMLSVSGIAVPNEVIGRIIIFMMLAFLFMLSYLALSVAISTFTKESTNSLMYSITVWLVLGLLLAPIASTLSEMITGQSLSLDSSKDSSYYEKPLKVMRDIMYISPSTHFSELITGPTSMSGDERASVMHGLFDTGFTLGYWVQQNWVNIVVLIVIPVIFLLISYMAFMRQDIIL